MRAHGIRDFPDPNSNGGFKIALSFLANPVYWAAQETCGAPPLARSVLHQSPGAPSPIERGLVLRFGTYRRRSDPAVLQAKDAIRVICIR
jgi:hypothetical protein